MVAQRGSRSIPRFLNALGLVGLVALATACASTRPAALALADEYYNLGNGWFDLKKYDQASKAYQKALALNPDLKVAAVNLARTKAETGDPDAALKLMEPLAESDPGNVVVAQYQAWLTAKKDGPAAAADLYQALATRLPGDPATQYNAGLCLGAAGRPEEALVAWKAWKLVDGKGVLGLTALAQTLDTLKSPEAVAAWSDVVAAYPEKDAKRFAALVARGRAQGEAEAYGDAVASWDAALDLPEAPGQNRSEVEFLKGRVLLVKIKDFGAGSASVVKAWNDGYKDAEAWKALRADPELSFVPQLEAALSAEGVKP